MNLNSHIAKSAMLAQNVMVSEDSRQKFIYLLQCAYSGELAAYYAYEGHGHSVSNLKEKSEIAVIQREELEHRECLLKMLNHLGAKPLLSKELFFTVIGRTISFLCYLGGWFIPMYGAGKLESTNIVEYEIAAQLAWKSGCSEFIDDLLKMAELEWDHEFYFRSKVQSHWLSAWVPLWKIPRAKESIRQRFQEFSSTQPRS